MSAHWEDAADQAIREIYEIDYASAHHMDAPRLLSEVRDRLEWHIDSYWAPVDGDAAAVACSWKSFGAAARALGLKLDFNKTFGDNYTYVHSVVCRKQRDYGHKNISRFGRQGLMVRLHDKVARLENLLGSLRTPNNESIEDNILDLVGYACLGVMWEEGTFLRACYEPTVAESPQVLRVGRSLDDIFTKLGFTTSP